MKKIAFILALVMVFAVCLVACDNTPADNSTPAAESSVNEEIENTESSEPEDSEEPEVSVAPEASDEVSEEPAGPEATENDPTLSFNGTNIALGLEVMNQNNIDAAISTFWVDADLTDGVIETAFGDDTITWQAGQWFGYYCWEGAADCNAENGVAVPTVDLGAKKTVYGVRANVYGGPGWSGVMAPVSGELLVSDDGENWTSVGKVNVTAGGENCVTWVAVAAPEGTNAQYVRLALTMNSGGAWMFIDELEIYGE